VIAKNLSILKDFIQESDNFTQGHPIHLATQEFRVNFLSELEKLYSESPKNNKKKLVRIKANLRGERCFKMADSL
jgi:hypothetical protein